MALYFEIDFLPVGDGEKGGDAAALRVWDDTGTQLVFVVDGGTKDSGNALVQHITKYYGTSTVNAVFCTHPDCDHASGLTEVLEKLHIKALVMHKPWEHAVAIQNLFNNPAVTAGGIAKTIRQELVFARELVRIADRKKIPVVEPFAGESYYNGMVHILSPSVADYRVLVPNFRCTPEPAAAVSIGSLFVAKAKQAIEWVAETMQIETLTDEGGHFSAENCSSAIILFSFGNDKVLFTGDADIPALSSAILFAKNQGIRLNDLHTFDVPHHGSQHNLGPTLLNAIRATNAHISAPPTSPKHPSKKIVNALIRRGFNVYSMPGNAIRFPSANAPTRPDWIPATALPFSNLVQR